MARLDAPAKVSGQTQYAADVALPGQCHIALVRSPFSHARITSIDIQDAKTLDGVVAIFTGRDLPNRTYGRAVQDVPVLARDEVRFVGERVVAVVAETREIAERAALRIRVDYDPLPAVFDAPEAILPDAPSIHAAPWSYPGAAIGENDGHNLQSRVSFGGGEVDRVDELLNASAFVHEAVYTTPASQHGYIEPQSCVAQVDEDGKMHLWIGNKAPYRLREQVGRYLEVDPQSIEVHPVAVGGDFGGKGSPMEAPLCLELARRVGRPVKLMLRYTEDLMATESRHAGQLRVRIGCDAGGHLTALKVDALFNGGAYAGFKPAKTAELHGMHEAGGPYQIPAVKVESRVAYTNTVPAGHMRAPGSPQAVFAVESAMDELAAKAGQDPIEFRRKNLLHGEVDSFGAHYLEIRSEVTLDAALAAYQPLPVPAGWLSGRGIAVYNRPTHAGKTSMRLKADDDGGVTAFVPIPETGTGSHTVVQRELSKALDLPLEKIRVRQVSTRELPHDDGVGGSRVTVGIATVTEAAVQAFLQQGRQGEVKVEVDGSKSPHVTSFCVQIGQVAIDPETGQVRVLQLLSAVDVANIVNPISHQIQIDGGMAMGYGFACLEDLSMTEGQVGAANLGDFKVPSARDVPEYRSVLVPGGKGIGAANVKAVGELTNVPTGAVVANAVADAAKIRLRDLPITAEKVFEHLNAIEREGVPS